MDKLVKYAEIPTIKKGIAFSDPWYDESVWCQYRKEFHDTDWLMKLETRRDEDNYINMTLSIGRRTLMTGLKCEETDPELGQFDLAYPSRFQYDEAELGIDTAKIFIGSLDNFEKFAEEGAVYTAADGMFGNLYAFTCRGEDQPAGFLLLAAVDGDITEEEELFQTLRSSFDGREIDKDRYDARTDPSDLSLRVLAAAELRHANAAKESQPSQHEKPGPEL